MSLTPPGGPQYKPENGYQPMGSYGMPPQAPPGYGQGPYTPPTNSLAVISMILGIAGFVFLPLAGSVAAAITGHIARNQIARTGENGSGFAMAGLVLGYIAIGISVLGGLGYLLFMLVFMGLPFLV